MKGRPTLKMGAKNAFRVLDMRLIDIPNRIIFSLNSTIRNYDFV